MKATDILKNEHRAIEEMISVLEVFTERYQKSGEFNVDHAEEIVGFFRNFADRCHHGKEEGILFPELVKVGVPREGGPIGVMLFEHDRGRDYIKGMVTSITKIRQGESAEEEFVRNALDYASLLREHIYKEDNILFHIADMHLSQEKQEDIAGRFEKFEKEEIGEGVHEEFHGLIKRMKSIYHKEG